MAKPFIHTDWHVCAPEKILAEANVAFEFNSGLFAALRPPTAQPSSTPEVQSTTLEQKTSEVAIATIAQMDRATQDRFYAIASFISLVAALSLAHIYMIFNGASGRTCPTRKIRQFGTA